MKTCYCCMRTLNEIDTECPFCGNPINISVEPHHLVPGTVLSKRYLIGTAIGEGGFGITYIGKDNKLDVTVAIKEFYPSGYVNRSNTVSQSISLNATEERKRFFEKGLSRFMLEAKILAQFSNKHGIVNIHDCFEENNTAYIVMEYLDGETLKDYLIRTGTMSAEHTIKLLIPIMESLKAVHRQGLIHRDISPDNIMLLDDGAKLLDFGAARNISSIENKSLSIVLKPGFSPEEQYRSRGEQGPWTDVYALCATMYKCITGITPDDATQRVHSDDLKSPSALGFEIDATVEKALMKGLSVLKNDRYQDINELVDGLRGINKGDAPKVKTVFIDKIAEVANTNLINTVKQSAEDQTPPKNKEGDIYRTSINNDVKKKTVLKKTLFPAIAILIAVIALVIFGFYYDKSNTPFESFNTLKAESLTQLDLSTTESESSYADWKAQYEKTLQQIIDQGYWINAIWVNDVDGDGIPMVALSTNNAAFKIPNIVLNYKNGKTVVKNDIVNSGSGWSVIDEVWFCKGTDYLIFRTYGNTTGTFTTNQQTIFDISDFGTYSVVAEDEIILPYEYELELEDLYVSTGGNFDFSKYQNYIKEELNQSAYITLGNDVSLVNFAEVMKDFGIFDSEEHSGIVIQSAIDYLNEQLGTNLSIKSTQDTMSGTEKVAQAYKKILSKCEDGNRYGLYDIDGNGVEELIVETGVYKRNLEWHIYTYDTFYENTTHHAGSFDATYYTLYIKEGQKGLYMYKLVKEMEELKIINVSDNEAEDSIVVSMQPYNKETAIDPGKELKLVEYTDYSLLNNILL